ncbi:MAG TPA: hypothetical protein VN033_15730 [Vulgatibacter sp.]|nr:hypothetical protein [Vulgatibacter sp.]
MRALVLGALALAVAGGCRHADATPPPGDGVAELRWTFVPGPADEGIPKATVVLRYDGTGTLDTGEGPREFTMGPIAMAGLVAAVEDARRFAGKSYGDAACDKACSHDSLEVKPVRGASWTLTRHGQGTVKPVDDVFFRLLHGVRPR